MSYIGLCLTAEPIFLRRTVEMGLLLDAAKEWEKLKSVEYGFDIARKNVLTKVRLAFSDIDFHHISGMQYASSVDFGLRKSEYCGERLLPAILNGKLNDNKITLSPKWNQICGRLMAVLNLQNILDNDFAIVEFNKKKVQVYSKIEAKYAIKSSISNNVYFIFLDERSGQYYCRSAFENDSIDFTKNQSLMTVLRKTKTTNGEVKQLYIRDGYIPEEE